MNEQEKTCNNCKYSNGWHDPDPCITCRFLADDRNNWEPVKGGEGMKKIEIAYLCNQEKDCNTSLICGKECNHTLDVEYAKNFAMCFESEEVCKYIETIVQCKDCRYFNAEANTCRNPRFGNGWANYPPPSVSENFFCYDGTRRETE